MMHPLTLREHAQLCRLLPRNGVRKADCLEFGAPCPRRHIKAAIDLDARSGWALQAYAEHGRGSDLAAALQINRELGAVLVAQARLAGLHAIARAYRAKADRG
jgi:hypothetical protein